MKHLSNAKRFLCFVISWTFILIVSRIIFHYKEQDELSASATSKILEFKSDINSEIVNALKMAYSPALLSYLESPSDFSAPGLEYEELQKWHGTFLSKMAFWISDKDMRYYANGEYLYTMDKKVDGNYWYERTFITGKPYLLNVNYDRGLQKTYLWIDVPVYDEIGKRAGVAGTGIPIGDFLDSMYKKASPKEKMYLYNNFGEVTSSSNVEQLRNKTTIDAVLPRNAKVGTYFPLTKQFYFMLKGEFIIVPIKDINWYLMLYAPFTVVRFIEHGVAPLALTLLFWLVQVIIAQNHDYLSENKVIKAQKKEIEMLNRNQNRFFASMSHEIRTPINTIIGLNEMTLKEDISDEVAENSIHIQSASKMLLHLINDILDMSKIESGQMEVTSSTYNTGDMLSDIVGMLWLKAREKNLEFHIYVDPLLPSQLIGDEIKIKQVLINVLTNAIKYTREGSVSFSIGCIPVEKSTGKVKVTYTVSDTGIGIKKENLPYIFSVFKRVDETKNRYIEGTGLGLSIVKQFVDLMGGTITVNSIYSEGTTFIIELPQDVADKKAVGELHLETRHAINYRKQSKRLLEAPLAKILVVDDNPTNRLVATKLLRGTKALVDSAASAKEALSKTLVTAYDLIFMDHEMPEMDGIECLHAIREQPGGLCKDIPIVALTANSGSENQTLYAKVGFNGYLLKPVSSTQLEETLLAKLPREMLHIEDSGGQEMLGEARSEVLYRRVPLIITTESVCDLPADFLRSNDVASIPYYVHADGVDFYDGIETDPRTIISFLKDENRTVVSEEPTVEEYEQFFAKQLSLANNVIHITMTSKASKGFEHACTAARSFGNVLVIDSKHISSGMGLAVMEAVKLCKEGCSVDQIRIALETMEKKIHTTFLVDNTNYLARAGRLSPVVDYIAQLFSLHPVIALKKGKMSAWRIFSGDQNHIRHSYIIKALANPNAIDKSLVFITHADLSGKELQKIEQIVQNRVHFDKVIFQKASSAVTANCGLGAFGIIFATK